MSRTWDQIAADKRKALLDSIPEEWRVPADLLPPQDQDNVLSWPESSGWFTKEELEITSLEAAQLVQKLAAREYTSEVVTRAFCKRAAAAHYLTNCLSETCFDRAIATARAMDAHIEKTGKPIGPLHGLPVSLKDNFNLKGLDATIGFVCFVGDPADDDACLAKMLQEAGAVFYVKTNVPTAMMIAETINNTFGRTTQPGNRSTTCGGSSGGEAALLAFKGSPLGVGTDIGGSLRIPAGCTGIYTLRPSFGRFPTRDCRSGLAGQETVNSVNGPMGRTMGDLNMYCKTIVDAEPWTRDAKVVPLPWRDVSAPAKMKIGVIRCDGVVQPTPPIARAINESVDKLKAAGHDVVDFDATGYMPRALGLIGRMFSVDDGKVIKGLFAKSGEPRIKEMVIHDVENKMGIDDLWKLHVERSAFQNEFLAKWNSEGFDTLLMPVMPVITWKHGDKVHIGYTSIFNILDYAATSFPTGLTADKDIDVLPADFKPLNDTCATINKDYDSNVVHGMPISLQLVARRLEEEKVLAMTERIVDIIGGTKAAYSNVP